MESDIGASSFCFVRSDSSGLNDFGTGLFLGHVDRDFRAIGLREPRLVFQTGGNRAVADFVRIAEFVEFEQFRRQRLAAGMALAFVLVDTDFQLGHCERSLFGMRSWPRCSRIICSAGLWTASHVISYYIRAPIALSSEKL